MSQTNPETYDPYLIPELSDSALASFAVENNCSYDTAEFACNGLPACDLDREYFDFGLIPYEQLGEGLRHA